MSNRDNEFLYNYIPNRKYGLPKRSDDEENEKQWSAVDIFVNDDARRHQEDSYSEHYEDAPVQYDDEIDEFDHEYVYFNKSGTSTGGDIYIRRQSRECETIMEEDEQEMVDFLSTRTSNVASSLGPNRSPDLSPANTAGRFRRQLPNQQSPFKIVEMHPAQKLPDNMSIVDSQTEKTLREYPFYNQIKSQVMHLPIELSNSDWSDEAKFCDELRNHGTQDTGRLTYHEMLLAFRRSQRTRSRCSSRASRLPTSSSTSQSQSTKQTPNHTDDESFHFDYLPNQQNQSPPEQSRRNDFKSSKHSASKSSLPGVQQRPGYQENDSEAVDDDDFAFPPPPNKDEPVYIRPSFPEKRNSRTRRARRDKYPSSAGAKNNASARIQEENQTPLSAKRTYNQSAYGPFTRSTRYQSYPNYPRYRQPVRRAAKSQPPLATYWLLAFLLFMLMFISLFPLMFM